MLTTPDVSEPWDELATRRRIAEELVMDTTKELVEAARKLHRVKKMAIEHGVSEQSVNDLIIATGVMMDVR